MDVMHIINILMVTLNRLYLPLLTAALALPETSCIYDDLEPCEDEKAEFTIINDWNAAPEADPEGMAYLFYPENSIEPWRFDFPGREAGKVRLPEGRYSFIMFNDDTSSIEFIDGDHGSLSATTKEVTIGFDPNVGEIRATPDMMWADASRTVQLGINSLTYASSEYAGDIEIIQSPNMRMITHPVQIVSRYTLCVKHIENISGSVCAKGLLTGMSSGINLRDNTHSEERVSLPFDLTLSADSSLNAEILTFGIPRHTDSTDFKSSILLFFKLSDGNTVKYEFDRTGEILSAPDPLNVKLTIDSINLPYAPPIEGNSGFAPSVAGWTTVIVNY